MSYAVYNVIHVAGLMLVFLGLGGALLAGENRNKATSILHGVGLLLMLVAGFGMLARLQIHWPWPGWVFGKAVVWLLLGAMPVLHRRKIVPTSAAWVVAAALGIGAAWMAIMKPWA